jgi:hypothetical protein
MLMSLNAQTWVLETRSLALLLLTGISSIASPCFAAENPTIREVDSRNAAPRVSQRITVIHASIWNIALADKMEQKIALELAPLKGYVRFQGMADYLNKQDEWINSAAKTISARFNVDYEIVSLRDPKFRHLHQNFLDGVAVPGHKYVYIMADGQQAGTNSVYNACGIAHINTCGPDRRDTRFENSFGREFEVDFPRARVYFGVRKALSLDPYFSQRLDSGSRFFAYPEEMFGIGDHFLTHSAKDWPKELYGKNYRPPRKALMPQSFLYYKLSKRFVRWANAEPSKFLKDYSGIAYNTTQFSQPAQSACFIGAKLTDQERYLALADCLLLPIAPTRKRLCDIASGAKLAIKCTKGLKIR